MNKNELKLILPLLKYTELWPMLAMMAVFVIFAWLDEVLVPNDESW